VRADDDRAARLNVIRYLIQKFEYKGKDNDLAVPDLNVIFEYDASYLKNGVIQP
jgi:hypothetical protein